MSRCAIYARVSTDRQAEEEIPIRGQVEACKKYAESRGFEVVGVYKDEGGHSSWTDDRPEFQRMYQAVKEKPRPFDFILVWRGNRLFRSVEMRLAYRRQFQRYGVSLVSLNEPIMEGAAGKVIETVIATFDEYQRALASEDSLRGLKQIASEGFSTGGRPPTGYRNIRKATGLKRNGEPIMRTSWEPDQAAAPLVLSVFKMCAEGHSSREIVEETKIVSAKNGLSTLLRNRAYIGERIYNTTRRASLNDKRTIRIKNDPKDFIVVKNCQPAIIPQDLFDKVQSIQDAKKPKILGRQLHGRRQIYLLSGLLWCKKHNVPYAGHTTTDNFYYACGERQKQGKKHVDCPWLKKEAIESFILDNLKTKIFTPELIRQGLEYLQKEQINNRHQDDTEELDIKQRLNQLNLEITNIKDAIKKGVRSDIFVDDLNHLADRETKLLERLDKILIERERSMQIIVTDESVKDVLGAVHKVLDITEPVELKAAIHNFIDRIEVEGSEVTISYTFMAPKREFVPVAGDPEGI